MLLENKIELNAIVDIEPISSSLPTGWIAEYVVYVHVTLEQIGGAFVFEINKGPYVRRGSDLAATLAQIPAPGGVQPINDPWPINTPGIIPKKALDVDVRRPSYVIIEIDSEIEWQFRTAGPGLTCKEARHVPYNSGLQHVIFHAGQIMLRPDRPGVNGCRVICFSVLEREAFDMHGVNLHVEFLQPVQGAIGVIIDPDIGNNGGAPYPPLS